MLHQETYCPRYCLNVSYGTLLRESISPPGPNPPSYGSSADTWHSPMNLVTGLWGMNVHVPGQDVEHGVSHRLPE